MEVIHDMFVKKPTALAVAILILTALTALFTIKPTPITPRVATQEAPQGTIEQATGKTTTARITALVRAGNALRNERNYRYPEPPFTDDDIEMLAKMVFGEARGCTPEEQSLVVWTVLQRVDAPDWQNTIREVVTARRQFVGYRESHPVDPDIYALCAAELAYWREGGEPPTHEIYAPSTPYYFFDGDGRNNWFREEY
jgi:hypothetical protein